MTAPSSYFPTRPDGTPTPHLPPGVRRTEYVVQNPDGTYRMVDREHAGPHDVRCAAPQAIVDLARAKSKVLRPQYLVGTAFHEAGFVTNTWETEPNGFVSVGPYQCGAEEAWLSGGHTLVDLLDLDKATDALVRLAENHRLRILAAIGPQAADAPELSALLGAAHNHGMGFVLGWIASHRGVTDVATLWATYQRERPTDNIVAHRYGADCITGGPAFPKETLLPPEVAQQIQALQAQITNLLDQFRL